MKPHTHVTLREALADPKLLGHALTGPSWRAWHAVLLAAMGEALTEDERALFRQLTGREQEPLQQVEEFVGVIGRRGGKSRAIGALATYVAGLCAHPALARGERGVLLCVAADQRQADIILGFIDENFRSSPVLRQLILRRTQRALRLKNGIDVEVRAADFRRLRGPSYISVIADELAFWMSDGSNPDHEILEAVRPGMATTRGQLFLISSPYARRGELWQTFDRHYGAKGDPLILVAQGASTTFNPTLDQGTIDRAVQRDPAAARAEWFGEFRSDLENFFTHEMLLACVDQSIVCRMPDPAHDYTAFVDPSGGSSDSMTLSINHVHGDMAVPDIVREVNPPFSPAAVVDEWAPLLRNYCCSTVYGDNFGAVWVRELFQQRAGVNYVSTGVPSKSELYLALLAHVNSRRCRLLDIQRLLDQALALERRPGRSGHDDVDHPNISGAHDDLINAFAGSVVLALKRAAIDPPMTFNSPIVFDPQSGATLAIAAPPDRRVPAHYLKGPDEPWRAYVGAGGSIQSSPGWCPPGGWTPRKRW